jgi:hypothetical protein
MMNTILKYIIGGMMLAGTLVVHAGRFSCHKTSHRITKEEKSGKIVANQGIGMETAE